MTTELIEFENINGYVEDLEDDLGDIRCPECKSPSVRIEGRCVTCETCGWSRCELD